MNAIKPSISNLFEGSQEDKFRENFSQFLLFGDPMAYQKRVLPKIEKYKRLVFNGFQEISASYYTIRDIEILFRSITSRSSKVKKSRLLSYHVHNYLNEIYILKTRLEQYPVKILRASKQWKKDLYLVETINEVISATFENIVAVRGTHVHLSRYSDDDLTRLLMLELLSEPEGQLGEAFRELFKAEFTICRRTWLERMHTNNDSILEILDAYFTVLLPLIFDETGNIIFPMKLPSA